MARPQGVERIQQETVTRYDVVKIVFEVLSALAAFTALVTFAVLLWRTF